VSTLDVLLHRLLIFQSKADFNMGVHTHHVCAERLVRIIGGRPGLYSHRRGCRTLQLMNIAAFMLVAIERCSFSCSHMFLIVSNFEALT